MRIRMNKTEWGSVDGVRVASYEAGREYDLTATAGERSLAAAFVDANLAEEAGAKGVAPSSPTEERDGATETSAPEGDTAPAPQAKLGRGGRSKQ